MQTNKTIMVLRCSYVGRVGSLWQSWQSWQSWQTSFHVCQLCKSSLPTFDPVGRVNEQATTHSNVKAANSAIPFHACA